MLRALAYGAALIALSGPLGVGIGTQATGTRGGATQIIEDGTPALPTLAGLSKSLTINGQTVEPSVWCQGDVATTSDWACDGATLTAAGSGGTVDLGSPLGADTAVDPAGARYWQAGDNDYADIDTEDSVFEVVVFMSSSVLVDIYAKRVGGSGAGVEIKTTFGRGLNLIVADATTTAQISTANGLDGWNHVIWFVDKSGSGQAYVNGVASGSATTVSSVGSAVVAAAATIGARSNGTSNYNEPISHFAVWKSPAWLDTHLQATVARNRAAAAFGIPSGQNSNTARASAATVERAGQLHTVGAGWMRVEGDGYLTELGTTNQLLQSSNYGTSWTATRATVGGSVTAPDGSTCTTCGIIASVDSNSHYVSQAVTTAGTGDHSLSVYAKAGAVDHAVVQFTNSPNTFAYWDLTDCSIGTITGTPTTTYGESFGSDGWCRIGFTEATTNTSQTVYLLAAEGDADLTFVGDAATVSVYFWGAQIEAQAAMTSHVATTTATASRSADVLQYTLPEFDIDSRGISLVSAVKWSDYTPGVTSTRQVISLSDGSSNNDRLTLFAYNAPDRAGWFGNAASSTQWSITGSIALSDGASHTLAGFAAANDARMFVDGTSDGTPDTSATMPDDLDTLTIGARPSGDLQPDRAHISRWAIYRGEVRE